MNFNCTNSRVRMAIVFIKRDAKKNCKKPVDRHLIKKQKRRKGGEAKMC